MNLNVSQGSRQSVVCLPDDAEPASAELVRLDDRAAHLTVRLEQLLVPCHELPGVAQLCRGDVDRMGDLSSAEHAVPNRRVCDEGPARGRGKERIRDTVRRERRPVTAWAIAHGGSRAARRPCC